MMKSMIACGVLPLTLAVTCPAQIVISEIHYHPVEVPAFNNWPLAGSASLFLTVMANGQTLYQTPPANLRLGAFQSGNLTIPFDISSSLYSQLQGQSVAIGGSMSMSEGRFWTITVSLSK